MEHRARAAVDEDEPRLQDEPLALHVGADGDHAAAAERVVDFLFALNEARPLLRREQDRAGHDQRLLEFLADALPVGDVGEDVVVVHDRVRRVVAGAVGYDWGRWRAEFEIAYRDKT
ncbi:MAG: hypothetical protein HC850_18380 [Rhodomicrobium sp.]|nr:hypothetical protein [Rhodomicrobium sp.]